MCFAFSCCFISYFALSQGILWVASSFPWGGGVSVYYSHVLQMLFFSYSQGKSFAATVSRSSMETQRLFTINVKG